MGRFLCKRKVGDSYILEANNGDHPRSRPARRSSSSACRSLSVHKGDVPYCSRGSASKPIETTVANNESRDSEREHITFFLSFL